MGVTTHRNRTKFSFPTDSNKLANNAIIQIISYALSVSQNLRSPYLVVLWTAYPRKNGPPGLSILGNTIWWTFCLPDRSLRSPPWMP